MFLLKKNQKNNYHMISLLCRIYKMKLFKKTETDSQTQETTLWLPGRAGQGVAQGLGVSIHARLCLEQAVHRRAEQHEELSSGLCDSPCQRRIWKNRHRYTGSKAALPRAGNRRNAANPLYSVQSENARMKQKDRKPRNKQSFKMICLYRK